eukprot:NODE_1938_length_863_cov_115.265356_g1356_i0.p2 GENE.NODE_1938_length_863_cov_115.265356_g1356_i0~~NODE_1938_length_863_cov_115.265356_g1356_i0.p2  ORF type:complete len:94 (-),score=37.48 NODE_1938_length_863_cov_115.265356_g1356_i0:528-809(-)
MVPYTGAHNGYGAARAPKPCRNCGYVEPFNAPPVAPVAVAPVAVPVQPMYPVAPSYVVPQANYAASYMPPVVPTVGPLQLAPYPMPGGPAFYF